MFFVPARYAYRDGGNRPRWIVIHDAEVPERDGAARSVAGYFASGAAQVSAHYTVDAGEIVQSVDERDGAWHTPGFAAGLEVNRNSIGIEHAGYARQSPAEWMDAYSTATLKRSAALVREIAKRYDIPVRHLTVDEIRQGLPGIAGHADFTAATGSGDHTDPGPSFPWAWYLGQVDAAGGASPAVKVVGAALLGWGIWQALKGR